jgi:hypothetical protein
VGVGDDWENSRQGKKAALRTDYPKVGVDSRRSECLDIANSNGEALSMQARVLPLIRVIRTKVSDPDKSIRLLVEAASGQRFWVTLPTSQVPELAHAAGLGLAAEHSERVRNHAMVALNASWFELLRIPEEPGALVLSLTFGKGAILTFRLPSPMPQSMLETLQAASVTDAQSIAGSPPPGNDLGHHIKQ